MVDADIQFKTEFQVGASPDTAFAFVADVARSARHYPTLDQIIATGNGGWRWKMLEKTVGPIVMRVEYEAVYTADEHRRSVAWAPPRGGGGDIECFGSWRIAPHPRGSTMVFDNRSIIHVPAPRLMKSMVKRVAEAEMSQYMQQYVRSIASALTPDAG